MRSMQTVIRLERSIREEGEGMGGRGGAGPLRGRKGEGEWS